MSKELVVDAINSSWFKSEIVSRFDDEFINQQRILIAENFCLDVYFIFNACDKDEAVKIGYKKIPTTDLMIPDIYYPIRFFIVPRFEILQILKRFNVAPNRFYANEKFYDNLALQIKIVNDISSIDLVELGEYALLFEFRKNVSYEQCLIIQDVLIRLDSNLLRAGLGGYYPDWSPNYSNEMADKVFLEQRLNLWWES